MLPLTVDVRRTLTGLPVVTPVQFSAAAYKLGQYVVCVTNSEGACGFGAVIARRHPEMEQAVGVLGHAVASQVHPDAPLPRRRDQSPEARSAAQAYASIGTWLMASLPNIEQQLGPYAAGCVVAALYGHGSQSSPLSCAVTTRALSLLDQVIRLCGERDALHTDVGTGAQGNVSAGPSVPLLISPPGDGVHEGHGLDG